jgi:hypothetical protein
MIKIFKVNNLTAVGVLTARTANGLTSDSSKTMLTKDNRFDQNTKNAAA